AGAGLRAAADAAAAGSRLRPTAVSHAAHAHAAEADVAADAWRVVGAAHARARDPSHARVATAADAPLRVARVRADAGGERDDQRRDQGENSRGLRDAPHEKLQGRKGLEAGLIPQEGPHATPKAARIAREKSRAGPRARSLDES